MAIELSATIGADAATVWRCLTETAHLRRWWNREVSLVPRPGGRFVEPWRDDAGRRVMTGGTVLSIAPQDHLRLSWADPDWPAETDVAFKLRPSGGATWLTLRHDGWTQFPAAEATALEQQHARGWARHLAALKAHAEAASDA